MAIQTQQRVKVTHRCTGCRKVLPHNFKPFCDCGAMIDVEYDLDRVHLLESADPLERFFDLLPIENRENIPPVKMGYTPCIHAKALGKLLGIPRLYLKDESVLPTGTTKDRMAAVALPFLRECGVGEFCTSSTGNSSTSFARTITHYPGWRMFLFTAENFKDRVHYEDNGQVVHFVIRGASFVDAFNCAAAFASRHGITSERGFFNPGRREGLKLAFLEAAEQIPEPIDWYVQAISSAMGVYGCYKGAKELFGMGRLAQVPRLLCVQQETCAPMVRAYEDGSETIRPEHIVKKPSGIAEAILRGDPTRAYPIVRRIVIESEGTFVAVSEGEIREARRMLEEVEGLRPCFSASAAFAGLVRLVRKEAFPVKDTVMVNLTGSDRPPLEKPLRVHWLVQEGENAWRPEDPHDNLTNALWNEPRSVEVMA